MSSIETIGSPSVSRSRPQSDVPKLVLGMLELWARNYRTRKQLADLTDAELQDLGLTRDAAQREAVRPFWEAGNRHTGQY